MAIFDKAQQLLGAGEIGLCVKTDGTYFIRESDGSGSTARWRVNPKRHVDKIIVFKEELSGGRWIAKLFTAQRIGATKIDARRYKVHLKNIRETGITDTTWLEFAGIGRNGVRYVP